MENLELELKLTVAHVNAILKHLAAGAYAEVADVIALLHGQAQPQMQAAAVTAKGQVFTNKRPTVITDTTQVVDFSGGDYTPASSIGKVGDYAIVAVTNLYKLWFKKGNTGRSEEHTSELQSH